MELLDEVEDDDAPADIPSFEDLQEKEIPATRTNKYSAAGAGTCWLFGWSIGFDLFVCLVCFFVWLFGCLVARSFLVAWLLAGFAC